MSKHLISYLVCFIFNLIHLEFGYRLYRATNKYCEIENKEELSKETKVAYVVIAIITILWLIIYPMQFIKFFEEIF